MHAGRTVITALLTALGLTTGSAGLAGQEGIPSSRIAALAQLSESLEAVSAHVSPAVVEIWVSALGTVGPSGSLPTLGQQERRGSGFVLASDGYVVTNAHVVQGARQVSVVLTRPAAPDVPGRSIVKPIGRRVAATIVGVDEETDLAVLRVDADSLPVLALADSDSLRPGNIVLAFGSPLGLESSVTMGVVSAVGRQLADDHPMVYIQTDTPINPGNSGGPLVDVHGRVVGISTLIFSRSGGSEGIGFAAPSNIVRTVYEQLRRGGRVSRGVIGVEAQTITPEIAAGLRLPQNWGVVLADVYPRSPAAAAGLLPGDVIAALDGKPMENARQFDVNVYGRTGDVITLDVRRGLERQSVRVRVVERGDDPRRVADLVDRDRNLVPELGVLALEVDETIGEMLPWLRMRRGIAIAARAAGTAPVPSGLESGDVIYAVNGQPVTTLAGLATVLRELPSGAPVVMHVDRRGRLRYFVFERP